MHSLVSVAHQDGYGYMQRNPENAVELVKPGMDIVIRAGSRLYWVNGTPDAADVAPTYRNRDVYVSDNTAIILARLARSSAAPAAESVDPPQAPASGQGPLTVSAIGGLGAETLSVFGSAPPNAPVRISLYGQISRDLPTMLLNTSSTVASAEGKYAITMPIAPDYFRGSIITVNAALTEGGPASTTTYKVGAPNPNVSIESGDPL